MQYLNLDDNAARQLIDSMSIYAEYRRVHDRARAFEGGMYWKQQDGYLYLVRTRGRHQRRVGPKSPHTESTYEAFTKNKAEIESRLKAVQERLRAAERLNKALRVGRVPPTVVAVLDAIEDAGLYENFAVVGTHALYAYETAAGVRVLQDAVATQDVDLLWDARKRIQFVSQMKHLNTSMLSIIQRADPTFQKDEEQAEVAINDRGFKVEFLRRMATSDDPHPLKLSEKENDLYAVQARRADVLAAAPPFEHVIVSNTGRMVTMKTIDPTVFVSFKRWMGTEVPDREAYKRRRDVLQADLVETLLNEGMLISRVPRLEEDLASDVPGEDAGTRPRP